MEPATVMNFNDFIKSFPHEVASQIDAHFWRQKLNFNENQKHLFCWVIVIVIIVVFVENDIFKKWHLTNRFYVSCI